MTFPCGAAQAILPGYFRRCRSRFVFGYPMYNAKRRESINDLFFYPVQGLLLLCAVRIYAYPTGDRFKFKECIAQNKGDARKGVSRPTIKKFLADKYKLDMSSAANISNLSNAIKRGAEKGQLTLPSGIAGRVKAGAKKPALVHKKSSAGKENVAPKKAASTETRKHAVRKGVTAPAAIKAVPTKKPVVKKVAPAVKKTSASKKVHTPKGAVVVPEKAAPRKKAAPKKAAA